jgi:oxygen-independent coproporphyrinogen-3 oxidase
MLGAFVRRQLSRVLAGQAQIALENRIPGRAQLSKKFENVHELGIYLHIPFCRQICPYCPYNKETYRPEAAQSYAQAVKREIDFYAGLVGRRPITSLYIGGGTPTTMLYQGLADILEHLHKAFNVRCDIHMESHPNDLTQENLAAIETLGVKHLSMGVEALQEHHLRFLGRPYTVKTALQAVGRAVERGFQCVNVDVMFALPGQTCEEVAQAGHTLVDLGVDQVAAYPLFRFPYTRLGSNGRTNNYGLGTILKRRKMLGVLEEIFYQSGFERTSVWAFTRRGVPRYCSVTVPLYLGLGASGGTYLKDIFYLNTFNVAEYVQAMSRRGMAIALALDLTEDMQRAGWLYWRLYETRFAKDDFQLRFGQDFDEVYGKYFKVLRLLGFLTEEEGRVVLTDRGSYWLHALEDFFSIEYISRLWGSSKEEPWPERISL